ncbi:MAG: amino acid racemase [Pseudomonadota bacterium]
MKRIGLIGGVSPESTVIYYRLINAAARAALGGDHSAEMVIYSLDFGVIKDRYARADWPAFKAEVLKAARALDQAGCELIGICSNTTQLAAGDVAAAIDRPVIGMIDTVAAALKRAGVQRPLLLGTPFVMAPGFYRSTLDAGFGGTCIVPDAEGQAAVDRVIFEELVNGQVLEASRAVYLDIIAAGERQGADAVILGCTEIPLLVDQGHTSLPVFDTTALHAGTIAAAAMER